MKMTTLDEKVHFFGVLYPQLSYSQKGGVKLESSHLWLCKVVVFEENHVLFGQKVTKSGVFGSLKNLFGGWFISIDKFGIDQNPPVIKKGEGFLRSRDSHIAKMGGVFSPPFGSFTPPFGGG